MGKIVKYVNLFVQSEAVESTTTHNGGRFIAVMMVVFIIYVVLGNIFPWFETHYTGQADWPRKLSDCHISAASELGL